MLSPNDRLSHRELMRRYDLVRAKMNEKNLDLLLISGIRFVAGAGYLRYLTNWAEPFGGEVLLFPQKGTPTFLARTAERAYLVKNLLGLESVTGSSATKVAEMVRRTGFRQVGICGLNTMVAKFYVELTGELPDVEFVESSDVLDEIRMLKSDEELKWVEKSANLSDIAFQAFSSLVRDGCSEFEVFVEVEHIVKRLGAENTYFMMAADPRPVPKFLDLAFDKYSKGDLILFNAEIAGPGGYFSQLVRTLSLGTPSEEAQKAFSVCSEALQSGESLLKPGRKTTQVYRSIRSTIEQGCHEMGLHPGHSQGLDIFERPILDGKDDVELKPGMVIVLHPHVLMPSGGGIWIGETFVITLDGYRRLQESRRDLMVLHG
jgi:Xaa-Pro aminopeptidase